MFEGGDIVVQMGRVEGGRQERAGGVGKASGMVELHAGQGPAMLNRPRQPDQLVNVTIIVEAQRAG